MKIRTKICGITRPEDALAAAEAGADAVGLVFYAKSKRAVTSAQAKEIVAVLPPFVSAVALFVNETAENIREILRQVPIDVIQFHGDEDDDFCRQFDRPYLKAVRVQSAADIQTACAKFPNARAVVRRLPSDRIRRYGAELRLDDAVGRFGQTVDTRRRADARKCRRCGENQRRGGGGRVRRRGKLGRD